MEVNKKDRKKLQTEQQVFHILLNIVETSPQYTFTQHLLHMLRKKNEKQDAYFWDDDLLLKKIQSYYDELINQTEEIE